MVLPKTSKFRMLRGKQTFLSVCCLCVGLGIGACAKSPSQVKKLDISETSPTPASEQSNNAEAQFLHTLKNAEALGQGNPLLLSSLYSLAAFYREQGEFDKAESQYKRALRLKEEMSGPDHPDVAMILHNYAALLRDARRYREAENLIIRAKAITTKSSSKAHSR